MIKTFIQMNLLTIITLLNFPNMTDAEEDQKFQKKRMLYSYFTRMMNRSRIIFKGQRIVSPGVLQN